MNKRQIIKDLRLKLREYFPNLQALLDDNSITENDWKFFGLIQLNLINCFTVTPEKAIRDSKVQLNKILNFYKAETRVRKLSLKSNSFIKENKIDDKKLQNSQEKFQSGLEYWEGRKSTNKMYFNYEIYLMIYYKWMNAYEFDEENTFKLILDLMEFCNYYGFRYYNIERLKEEKTNLIEKLKICVDVLVLIETSVNNNNAHLISEEAGAHLN